MVYNVVITETAARQFDKYIAYVVYTLKNKQAARNIIQDFHRTQKELSLTAHSIKLLDDCDLRQRGYRKINFQKHNYIMLYRIDGNTAVVDGIYHCLQDYENIFK